MNLYPAIDLRGGMCVRLEKGNFSKETVYSKDPGAMARRLRKRGPVPSMWWTLTDALAGKSENLSAIKAILREGGISIEVGGGIRTYEQIEGLLSLGVSQVILALPPSMIPSLWKGPTGIFPTKSWSHRCQNAYAAADGWEKDKQSHGRGTCSACRRGGDGENHLTDISRDGMMNGSNIEATAALYQACGVPITASGGVSSLEDIRRLKARETDGIEGWHHWKKRFTPVLFPFLMPQDCRGGVTMLAKRIIPCLDVKAGRVVKGTNFVFLRDAGDPVELAAHMNGSRPMN